MSGTMNSFGKKDMGKLSYVKIRTRASGVSLTCLGGIQGVCIVYVSPERETKQDGVYVGGEVGGRKGLIGNRILTSKIRKSGVIGERKRT